jgi:hypothetical protein
MKAANRDIVLWAPRIVGLGLALFLSLFALDAFSDPRGLLATVIALLMGLIPALITLAAVAIGWKHQGIAAIIFLVGAVFYAALALDHPDWILIITGPLVLEAVLFYLSWRQSKHKRPTAQTTQAA